MAQPPDARSGRSASLLAGADFDVLIVGAGPTGLLAACELLRRGVRVRIVDRAAEPATAPKALSVWPRVRDILDDLGVGDEIRRISLPIRSFSYFSDRRPLGSFFFTDDLAARQLPQPQTERILTERLTALGGKVERPVRLLALDGVDFTGRIAGTDPVTAVLEHADGSIERARCPFVVGADGAGSTVRGQLGIGFQGLTYEMNFALIDTHVDGALPSDDIRYYQSPTGTLVVVPQSEGVFRFLSVAPGDRREIDVPTMQALIDERGPRGVRITDPVWQTVFRVHARHATRFQLGRVFLMGDAAHVHSPAGGQGMNNGLQDANNLGWKLAAVLHGVSPVALLASYGPERQEATRRIVRDTDLHTRAWMVQGPVRVRLRDTAFRALFRTGMVSRHYAPVLAGRRLAYRPPRADQSPSWPAGCAVRGRLPGVRPAGTPLPRPLALASGVGGADADPTMWTVLVRPPSDAAGWLAELGHLTDRWPAVRVVRLPRISAGGLCRRPGYHLVRPDGHVGAHGHDRDLNRLEAELRVAFAAD